MVENQVRAEKTLKPWAMLVEGRMLSAEKSYIDMSEAEIPVSGSWLSSLVQKIESPNMGSRCDLADACDG